MIKKIGQLLQKKQHHIEQDNESVSPQHPKDMSQEQIMQEIQAELSEALKEWKWTIRAYEYALGDDQVEYCIYQMMAAEQKYRMILHKARQLDVNWSKVRGYMI